MKYEQKGKTFTVTCDTYEQCYELEDKLREMIHDYRLVYVCIPEHEDVSQAEYDFCFTNYFYTLDDALHNVRNTIVNKSASENCDKQYRYAFYSLPLVIWQFNVSSNEDIRQLGTKVTELQYRVKIETQEIQS